MEPDPEAVQGIAEVPVGSAPVPVPTLRETLPDGRYVLYFRLQTGSSEVTERAEGDPHG